MKKQNGFTLIELVVVIAILGILAAIALPKFVSLTSEARIAKMKGGAGAMTSAAALIHAKWLAAGSPTTGNLAYDGGTLNAATQLTTTGYPKASVIKTVAGMSDDFVTGTPDGTGSATTIQILDATGSSCAIVYDEATASVNTTALTSTNCK